MSKAVAVSATWPWADLPVHSAVIDRLRGAVEADASWRWLEICCSLAAGRGDELSDVDAGIGYVPPLEPDGLERAGLEIVDACGGATDVLVHVPSGWPAETRRVAAELDAGVQLDLVFMPAERRTGLPTGAVAVVDKDGRLSTPWQPPVEDAPTAQVAREWLLLGWWALGDVVKYLRRGSLFEAVDRLAEARHQALRLDAVARGIPFPSFGLISLLDFPPYELPSGLAATYSLPTAPEDLLAAADATGTLLDRSAAAAAEVLGVDLATPWASSVRRRMATIHRP